MGKRKRKQMDKFDADFLNRLYAKDDLLFKNRDKKRYKLIAYLSKEILCDFHVVSLIRRYYLDLVTGKHIFLLDEWLEIEKYKHIARKDREFIKKEVYKQKATYTEVASVYENCISPSTVHRLIKNESISYDYNFNLNPSKYKFIYIDIDDAFRNMRIHNQKVTYKFKVVHAYQDYERNKRNKRKFINEIKMVLVNKNHTNSKDYMNWAIDQIKTVLIENYGDLKDFSIVVSGDGATYIKTIAKALNAQTGLDHWHLTHKITTTFQTQPLKRISFINDDLIKQNCGENNLTNQIINLIEDGKLDRAFKLLLKIKTLCNGNCRELNGLIDYLIRNKKSIEIWSEPWYHGTFTETFVEQLVKQPFGNVGRCYSLTIFMKILKANCLTALYR